MSTNRTDAIVVIGVQMLIIAICTIIGATCVGIAPVMNFSNPVFIAGYVFLMLMAVFTIIFIMYLLSIYECCEMSSAPLIVIVVIFAIIGGTLVGIATPQNFTNGMFIAGFVFLMIMALLIVIPLGLLCLSAL